MHHDLVDDDTCAFCDQESETIAHLLTQCSFAQQIWHDVLGQLNLQGCLLRTDKEFTSWFEIAASNAQPAVQKEPDQSLS
jgi:hypothetical protein